jgi:hypothetical protein
MNVNREGVSPTRASLSKSNDTLFFSSDAESQCLGGTGSAGRAVVQEGAAIAEGVGTEAEEAEEEVVKGRR